MALRFMFHYPETNGTDRHLLDAGPLGEVAAAAERAGFDGFSLTEHPIPGSRWLASGGHQSLDPFVALGHVAAVTSRLRLLTHLSVAPYRNPFLLAKAAATVDTLSGGRFILGLGTGYHKTEFRALGVDIDERNALFDEALDVLPRHWSGEEFSYEGRHFDARWVQARPAPPQQPIPIWIGGNSKLSRRRVAQRAQGWMPMGGGAELTTTARTPPLGDLDDVAGHIAAIRAAAAAAGRDGTIDVLHSYADRTIETLAEPERHRDRFGAIEKAGATWVLVTCPSVSAAATVEFLDGFGAAFLG